jgi:hypothetical protein
MEILDLGTTALFGLPVLLLMAAVIALVIWVIIRLARNPAEQAAPAGSAAAVGMGQWNAQVRARGVTELFSGYGVLTLGNGMLSFFPKGASAPEWSLPAQEFELRPNSAMARNDVTMQSARTGELLVTVSHQKITRMSQNTMKELHEREVSAEFLAAMRAAGAVVTR